MAMNPMQRKANNSFLLGILLTLVVTGAIIAFLVFQLINVKKEEKQMGSQTVYGYILTSSVKSGEEITSAKVTGIELKTSVATTNMYISASKTTDGDVARDANGNVVYRTFMGGVKAKVDMASGVILTSDLTYEDEVLASDIRVEEYNMIILPSQLETGEYVDIRLRTPSGTNYIVASHKQVEMPIIDGVESLNTIWLKMSETEILTMSSAIVETYLMDGAILYATKYVEPGIQSSAIPTYLPSDTVLNLMSKDPNAVQEAKNAIFERNNNSSYKSTVRNPINSAINSNPKSGDDLITSVQEEITKRQEERQRYLESLGGSY